VSLLSLVGRTRIHPRHRLEMLREVQDQHPDDRLEDHLDRVHYRNGARRLRKLGIYSEAGLHSALVLTGALVIGIVVLSSFAHCQTSNVNIDRVGGTKAAAGSLNIVCLSGCGGASSFLDNAAFTAGTTPVNITGGWYSTAPSNCTDGRACAPQLTIDRKLMVQAFQGTSPFADNVTQWASGVLGSMANYGTSPGSVLVPGVNAFVTNVPHIVCDSGCGGATTFADNAAFTFNTTPIGNMGAIVDDTATNTVAENSAGTPRMNTNRILYFNPRNNAGTELATAGNPYRVDPTGTTPQPASQSGTWNVNATLSAETTKVIGTINVAAGQTIAVTQATGTNLHAVLDTTSTTAVTQATGTNLHAVTDSGSVTAATLSAETTKVIGTVRALGNSGGVFDAANNAAAPANVIVDGFEAATQTSTQPTAATAGNVRRAVISTDGSLYVRPHGPVIWSCGLSAIGTTLTQCQAAPGAGLRLYITDIVAQSNTATAGLFTVRFGTGTNCATGPGNLFFASASALIAAPANTVPVDLIHLTTPIAVTAANAICVLGVVTNTTNIEINGYTAP
jgi:hypothetical protein